MYLHVGEEIIIKTEDIIAIIDKESIHSSQIMDEFVNHHKQQAFNVAKGAFKSVVITSNMIYYSPFSADTLKKRSHVIFHQE